MMNFINKIEDNVIRKYGFENRKTIAVFRITAILRGAEIHRYNISDYPFVPDVIDGYPVLCIHGDIAICG